MPPFEQQHEGQEQGQAEPLQAWPPCIMHNKTGGTAKKPVAAAPQAPHIDLHPETDGGATVQGAVHEPVSIQLVPGSHLWTKRWRDKTIPDKLFYHMTDSMTMFRMRLKPGRMLVFDGHLLHAGDGGKPGSLAMRMHGYVCRRRIVDFTFLLSMLGSESGVDYSSKIAR